MAHPPAFDWEDPLQLEQQLGPQQRALRDAARDYAQGELAARLPRDFRAARCDAAIWREMGRIGLLGATLAPEQGGSGLGQLDYGLVAREIERVDSGYRSMLSVQSSLVMLPIARYGSDWQRQQFLPALASGELIGCFGLTEPDHGSDPASLGCKARAVAGGWRLSGAKTWISHSPLAGLLLVWARTDDGQIHAFVLERGWSGLATPEIDGKCGLRTSCTGQILLQDVYCPYSHLLPEAAGLGAALRCLDSARFGIAWGALGAAEDCLQRTRNYVLERQQFGRPLAARQLIQVKLADMVVEVALGLQSCLRVAQLRDAGAAVPELTSLVKRNSCAKALQIARQARDMLGANGISDDYGVIRHLLNLEVVNTYEGTEDMHRLILGRAITGIPAFAG